VDKEEAKLGSSILKLHHVEVKDNRGIAAVNDLSFELRGGEILGIAGVDGNGQRELIEAITGLRKIESGEIILNGKPIHNAKPRQITEAKVGYIPEDRQKRGLVLDFTVSENMVLKNYSDPKFGKNMFLDYEAINQHATGLIKEYDVRTPNEITPARALSGGNQQKVIIAREVYSDPDLLIATQPTRGLDVGAIEFIHKKLVEQRDNGKAVLLYSLELDEIMNLSDRIAVMYEGRIVGIVDPKTTSDREIGLMMSGSGSGQGEETT
jgi:simple sugar transport system ATP-binding protein